MKKVIVFLADGTEEIEALTPVDMLRRAGAEVTFAGVPAAKCTCSHGVKITADKAACDCVGEEYDMVVLPGGMPGTLNLGASEDVKKIVTKAYENGKFVAAICAAPSVLGGMGLLAGKRATCYPGFEEKLTGACVVAEKAVRDGNIITACGAGAAMEFALLLVAALYGEETSENLRKAVLA
ncbi:MAG: DJ-1/PfpI family protein [Clostridia bacterium]|nr:DJ-1/PfpI family protein [Clostridia bacterium]